MYKVIDSSQVNEKLEESFSRYNFILRDIDINVPKADKRPYIPGYSNCKVLYNSDNHYFCIYEVNYNKLIIHEFYDPGAGKKLLNELLKTTGADIGAIDIVWLEIIDKNDRAKKFWFKELGYPLGMGKNEYWITEYTFIPEVRRLKGED